MKLLKTVKLGLVVSVLGISVFNYTVDTEKAERIPDPWSMNSSELAERIPDPWSMHSYDLAERIPDPWSKSYKA